MIVVSQLGHRHFKMIMNSHLIVLLSFVHYLSASTCNFNVRVHQTLQNEGFHRNITYEVIFNEAKGQQANFYKNCILGIDQTLPAGVYVNPDELSDLRRTLKVHAVPKNRVNVELPAEQSDASSVYVIGRVTDDKVTMWLPVHARYHHAVSGGGMARNRIESPKLYLRCPDRRLDVCERPKSPAVIMLCNGSSKDKCSWQEIPYSIMTEPLSWEVPVGNLDLYYTTAVGTAVAVAVGSLYLLKAIHEQAIAAKT